MKKMLLIDITKFHNRINRTIKRIERLENKYYSWQHYFDVKRKRFKAQYAPKREISTQIQHLRKKLKNLSIKQVKGTNCSKNERRHILVMANNDVIRLRRFIKQRHYLGRKSRKREGQLMDFTKNEKWKLERLLKKDWRKK